MCASRRRYIKKAPLPPAETYAKLKQLEALFAPIVCKKKKGPLFTKKAQEAWKHLLGLIRDGHHGELPDVPRYISLGIDSNTQLERFASIANTSWVEAWHNPQKESAPHGVGMVYADLVLHMVVERANDHAKIKYKKGPDFGALGVHISDDSVIEEIYLVRKSAPAGTFEPDVCDHYEELGADTEERFGLGWRMREYFGVLAGSEGFAAAAQALEQQVEFSKIGLGSDVLVQPLDIRAIVAQVQGKPLCDAQDEVLESLELQLSRSEVKLTDLLDPVIAVIDADSSPADEVDGAAAAGTTASTGESTVVATARTAAERLALRTAAKERQSQIDQEAKAQRKAVVGKVGLVLLGNAEPPEDAMVSHHSFDVSFVEYSRMLAGMPNELARDWKAGQTVLGALNQIHGIDEMKVFTGIRTQAGYLLYERLVKEQSKDNKVKVAPKKIAVAWNAEVDRLIVTADSDSAKTRIRQQYGYVSQAQAWRFNQRVELRIEQTELFEPLAEGLKGMYAEIRHREVAELPPPEPAPDPEPHSSARSEAARPGAIVHKPSVLVPRARKRDAPLDEPTRDEVNRTCYLCFEFSGKPREECYKKKVNGDYTTETGHRGTKQGTGHMCTWFDDEFNMGATEEATAERRKKAKNARNAAFAVLRRAKGPKLN